jgi:diguanylate cyclase (GGDEF)-like protein/PAS domain S-box-containing protein
MAGHSINRNLKLLTTDVPRPRYQAAVGKTALRQLADSAPMIIWMTDANGACIYVDAGDMQVAPADVHLAVWVDFIHSSDLPRVGPEFQAARKALKNYQLEYRILRSDGSTRWIRSSGAPRFSADGGFIGYVGAIIDISSHHQALSELARSEATHRLLTDNSSDLIFHHAAGGKLLNVSPACKRMLGYEAAELIGTNLLEVVHPDDASILLKLGARYTAGGEGELVEVRVRHKQGHYIWIASAAKLLFDPVTGAQCGAVSVARDITLERQAKEELARREERFRSLTDLSSDWYWEADEHDRITFISEGARRLCGVELQRVLGKTRRELAFDQRDLLQADYFGRIARREAFRDLRYRSNWSPGHAHHHVCISGEPLFENGVFKGYRGVGRDITEEMAVAERLAHLAAENKAVIDNSLDIMVLSDIEGRILRINDACLRILGYRPDELQGRDCLDLVAPQDRERTLALCQRLRIEQTASNFENCWVKRDGSLAHLSWSLRCSSETGLTYATARDIGEARRTRDELHQSNRRLYAILESIDDAFFALDNDWRCTYANHKTAQFVGHPVQELVGKLLWEVVPQIVETTFYAEYLQAMQTRRTSFFVGYWEAADAWLDVRVYPSDSGISVFFHDITARRKAEIAIRDSEQRFRQLIEMTPAGYVLTDAQRILVDVNPALCGMSGYLKEQLVGRHLKELFPVFPIAPDLLDIGAPASAHGREAVLRHRDGQPVYVLVNLNIGRDALGNARELTAFITDITERKQTEARLEQLATHDTLTDLPNRSYLNERLQQMLEQADGQTPIAVIFIDLDRFKEVNDSLGHEQGDVLLCEVARRLQRNMRPTDVVARLGGDEFVVAAHCSEGVDSAAAIADKLLAVLAEPIDVDGHEVFVGASAGISLFPRDGQTREALFQHADTAMYRAKMAGRNGYRFFEQEMSVEAKTRMTLEQSLRRALERDEFELHYQPRLDLANGRLLGMEALLRWNHPQLGQVSPLQFIPIAEERGFIEAIGRWVLEEACAQTRRLTDRIGRPLRVSVNLSARQLKCHDLREQVQQALLKAGLAPQMLELELTESALIEDMEVSASRLGELKQLGILLAVDDFGTGYSGLAYLQNFPLDVMKLDRSFINRRTDGSRDRQFIKALIDLAHTLNLSVVAEGIDSDETLQFLRACSCDEGQGYLFSRPLPIDEFEKLLAGQ